MTPPSRPDSAPPDKTQPTRAHPRRGAELRIQPIPSDTTQPSLRTRHAHARAEWPWWSVVSLLLLVLVALVGAGGSLAFALRTPPPVVWPTVALVTVTRESWPTPVAVTETPRASVPSANVKVAGTQGLSLRIRAAPSTSAETVKLVPDGTHLIVTGDGQQAEGALWWPVRDPSDDKTGWAVSTYLIPDTGP